MSFIDTLLELLFFMDTGRRGKRLSKEFSDTLLSGLKNGTVTDYNDVQYIYIGVMDDPQVYLDRSLSRCLFAIYSTLQGEESEIEAGSRVDLIRRIREFIEETNREEPYDGLPTFEKNLLREIEALMKAGDHAAVIERIKELVPVIQEKERIVKKLQIKNKFAVYFALISLAFTIVFGVIGYLSPSFTVIPD